ncbi:uncharacterized protein V1516DRAFT_682553 [Lipomyces oligophaga]|uniref:uncharacterized protein n=1 Tax=Lipomyces oligophaga TaxID=45792 RepID=UPI0034CD0C35
MSFLTAFKEFDETPSDSELFAKLISIMNEQEQTLIFPSLTSADAKALAEAIFSISPVGLAPTDPSARPIVVAVYVGTNLIYYSGQDGTATDNFEWIQRKATTVRRFGHASLYMGVTAQSQGSNLNDRFNIPTTVATGAGGGFPIRVAGVPYPVGFVGVSGLPHYFDHDVVVKGIEKYLKSLEK